MTKIINGYAHGAEGRNKEHLTGKYCRDEFEATACIEKLAEYEELEEHGKLLRLPVAVGDTVYTLNPLENGKVVIAETTPIRFSVHYVH